MTSPSRLQGHAGVKVPGIHRDLGRAGGPGDECEGFTRRYSVFGLRDSQGT